jgi:hypothetical protein
MIKELGKHSTSVFTFGARPRERRHFLTGYDLHCGTGMPHERPVRIKAVQNSDK